ncbi:sulfate transporter CysZ [Alcanivorax sp.]|uniref:sulfate transporter CysZ n=1 Tax=Alcanivorax sp. TaxID=1872427 RepID=UPI000C569D15|nr:sulfate transporter CysZ [Alcanivorax sp.]MBQ25106.1 sulfate transporter CysZ [Alcanivorax sp.]
MSQIADAVAYLSRSLKLARTPELRRYVIIPLIFNILVFGGLYWLSGSWIAGWITAATADWALTGFWSFLNGALHFLVDAAVILVWILLLGLFASVFSIGVQLIAAPFMGFLAEKVDIQVTGHPMNDESIPAMIVRTFKRELRKTWYWLWRAVLILFVVGVVYFIPVINVFASAIWFLWSGWLLGMQYIDFGADNRQVPFEVMLERLKEKRWLVLTFGAIVMGLTMIPLVNLFIMPVAVIAGTLIWVEQLAPQSSEPSTKPL